MGALAAVSFFFCPSLLLDLFRLTEGGLFGLVGRRPDGEADRLRVGDEECNELEDFLETVGLFDRPRLTEFCEPCIDTLSHPKLSFPFKVSDLALLSCLVSCCDLVSDTFLSLGPF